MPKAVDTCHASIRPVTRIKSEEWRSKCATYRAEL